MTSPIVTRGRKPAVVGRAAGFVEQQVAPGSFRNVWAPAVAAEHEGAPSVMLVIPGALPATAYLSPAAARTLALALQREADGVESSPPASSVSSPIPAHTLAPNGKHIPVER